MGVRIVAVEVFDNDPKQPPKLIGSLDQPADVVDVRRVKKFLCDGR